MKNGKRGRYTLEFKLEAVRLLESGQSIAEAACSLGVVEQTLFELGEGEPCGEAEGGQGQVWCNGGADGDQSLAAELVRVKMERDILGKATAYVAKG